MSDLEHTPGPWKISKCECGHPACDSYFINVTSSDGRLSLGDAQLIAAAPDMLDALKGILDCQEHFYTEQGGIRLPEQLSPWGGVLQVIFKVAREAVTKVGGKEV